MTRLEQIWELLWELTLVLAALALEALLSPLVAVVAFAEALVARGPLPALLFLAISCAALYRRARREGGGAK